MSQHSIISENIIDPSAAPVECAEGDEITQKFQSYLADESRLAGEGAEKLYFPESAEQVAQAVKQSFESGTSLTVAAARTGITGASVPDGGNLLSLDRMVKVLAMRKEDSCWLIDIEPGITLNDFAAKVAKKDFADSVPGAGDFKADENDYFYPVDPTERTAAMGGTAATNASGARTYFYGPTRDYIEGLKVVLDNGELISVKRGEYSFDSSGSFELADSQGSSRTVKLPSFTLPEVKHAAGYWVKPGMDLVDLFIGSEGTLGVIVELTVKVIPVVHELFSCIAFFPSNEDAVRFTIEARNSETVAPLALEFFDSNSLGVLRDKKAKEGGGSKIREIPGYANAAIYFEQGYTEEDELFESMEAWEEILGNCNSSMDNTWGGMEESEQQLLKDFRHEVPEGVNNIISERKRSDDRIHKVGTDMAVPDQALEEIYGVYTSSCEKAGLEYAIFGHIGNNHLHVNILPRDYSDLEKALSLYMDFAKKVVDLGGSVAAEHGIGKMKKKFLPVMFGEEGVAEMKAVKDAFDPKGILCPGNLF